MAPEMHMPAPVAPVKSKSEAARSPGQPHLSVGGVRIRPRARSLVVPAVPTTGIEWLSLSNLDRVVNPTFSSVIMFYENVVSHKTRSFEEVTQHLKESLAKTLVPFFPLAGRLALREDGLVDVLCNDAGAIFLEASVDKDLNSLGGAKPTAALSGLQLARIGPGPNYVPDQLRSMPALVVTVTLFKCGSIAVAANWHHTIADGSSGCHFLKSWAEVSSGQAISLVPNHDRMLLKARDTLDWSLVNGYSTKTIKVEGLEQELETEDPRVECCDTTKVKFDDLPTEEAIISSFHISKDSILRLKEKVTEGSEEGSRSFTSAESISAHLWQEMTIARQKRETASGAEGAGKVLRDNDTRFFMFVDGRKKLSIPAGYFGNVVCSACAVAGEDDIVSKPLAHAAGLIRKATRGISAEYFRSLIDWVEAQGLQWSKSEHMNSVGHDVAATFWTFFPLYELDFGWGKPALATRNSPPRQLIDGISVMPTSQPGNMIALVNLHADRMRRLRQQDSFHSNFTYLST